MSSSRSSRSLFAANEETLPIAGTSRRSRRSSGAWSVREITRIIQSNDIRAREISVARNLAHDRMKCICVIGIIARRDNFLARLFPLFIRS